MFTENKNTILKHAQHFDQNMRKNSLKMIDDDVDSSDLIQPKKVEELQQRFKSILHRTPLMPALLQKFTLKPITKPFSGSSIFKGYFDGCSKGNPGLSSVGYRMTTQNGISVFESSQLIGERTNNQAYFTGILFMLVNAYINGMLRVNIFGNSKIAVDSLNGKQTIKDENLLGLYESLTKVVVPLFIESKFAYIETKENIKAKNLAEQAFKSSKAADKVF